MKASEIQTQTPRLIAGSPPPLFLSSFLYPSFDCEMLSAVW